MIVQTRSEENGLVELTSLKDAFAKAKKDKTIWKISFSLDNGERVRPTRQEDSVIGEVWIYESLIDEVVEEMENV